MDWKALRKALTPKGKDLVKLATYALVLIVVFAVLMGSTVGLILGIHFGLLFFFSEATTTNIEFGFVVAFWSWVLLIQPIYSVVHERYKEYKRENQSRG